MNREGTYIIAPPDRSIVAAADTTAVARPGPVLGLGAALQPPEVFDARKNVGDDARCSKVAIVALEII